MKESDEYDAQALPVSGPFAGLDPEQLPVIVDQKGERVPEPAEVDEFTTIANAIAWLSKTHHIIIERGPGQKATHRIVLGDDVSTFFEQLASSLDAALAHHKGK